MDKTQFEGFWSGGRIGMCEADTEPTRLDTCDGIGKSSFIDGTNKATISVGSNHTTHGPMQRIGRSIELGFYGFWNDRSAVL